MVTGELALSKRLFEQMCIIRCLEETLLRLFSEGRLSGTIHTCIGQEAIAVAVGSHLAGGDIVFASHRSHGHYVAYGGPLERILAEVMGRETGLSGGRGGSQHLHYGRLFCNGIQGGIVGNAVGAALAEQLKGTENIVVVFLGDGTLGEGLVYESLNFASLRKLPVLFVLENNRYAQSTPVHMGVAGSMTARAGSFGIAADEIESNDAVELYELMGERISSVRNHRSPFFQVIHTYRLGPHSKGDDYRDPTEIGAWRQMDPLLLMRRYLSGQEAEMLQKRAESAVRMAVGIAEASSFPTEGDLGGSLEDAVDDEELSLPLPTSDVAFAQSLNRGLAELLQDYKTVILMGEDILDPYGGAFGVSKGLSSRFPDRVISTPISEAGIIAWGVGAALLGLRPIVEIMFGDFLALGADQLLNHGSKYRWMYNGEVEVPLVVRTPMGGGRGYGPTHSQSIEKMFLGIPGLTVVAPSHLLEPGELLRRSVLLSKTPVLFIEHKLLYGRRLQVTKAGRADDFYIRGTRGRYPTLHLSLTDFEPPDLTLICYGGSCPLAMEVARDLLVEHETVADLVVPSLLSPLPVAAIHQFLRGSGGVVVIEEGSKPYGWGSEVVAALSEFAPSASRKFMRLAAADCPIPASRSLETMVLPTIQGVTRAILDSFPVKGRHDLEVF